MKIKPFTSRHVPYIGQKNFDKFYITPVVNKIYKKVGDTDKYTEVLEVIEDKKDIDKYINSQASDVGLDAYLKPYEAAGIFPEVPSAEEMANAPLQDFSNFPEDLAGATELGKQAQETFNNMDPALTKGKNIDQFLSTINTKDIIEYLKKKTGLDKKPAPKIEKKEGVSNETK